jgi:hypothetical protein
MKAIVAELHVLVLVPARADQLLGPAAHLIPVHPGHLADAGAVHQDIERAELAANLLEHPPDVIDLRPARPIPDPPSVTTACFPSSFMEAPPVRSQRELNLQPVDMVPRRP